MNLKIDPKQWTELNRLLDQALEVPAGERARWLDCLDPALSALTPQLRELLAFSSPVETSDFLLALPNLPQDDHDATREDPGNCSIGALVGPYRLLREIGSGGMGAVWLAERADGLLTRKVALKLPHVTYDSARREVLAGRMAREREILATLNHPNITTLYDAGVGSNGQPYLALEFVSGEPIDQYCKARALPIRERLLLFQQVAHAVAYAHGMAVVHRDLKPSNILVTADGQVQLLDFGIATMLGRDVIGSLPLTEVSGRALTPDYASPEQITGDSITTSSDVYSLGVVLYELLTDSRPYRIARRSHGALEDAILQSDPPHPSSVVVGARRRDLAGDLDAIIMTALRKPAAERFATVHAFAEDIQRHLDMRPVMSRPDNHRDRFRKFIRRNKLLVTGIGGVAATLVLGATVSLWQARLARQQERRAEEVTRFIASVFKEADPGNKQGRILSAPELLRQAIDRLRESAPADASVGQELRAIIGDSFIGLEQNQDAAAVLEEALAIEATRSSGRGPLAARLHLSLAAAYGYLGRTQDAKRQLSLARKELSANDDDSQQVTLLLQETALALDEGNFALAEAAAGRALNLIEAQLDADPVQHAETLTYLGMIYGATNRPAAAVLSARRGLQTMLAVHGGNAKHPAVVDKIAGYANALAAAGDYAQARQQMRSAVAGAIGIYGADAMMTGYMLNALSYMELELGDVRSAITDAQRSVDIDKTLAEPNSVAQASRLRNLGFAVLAAGDMTRAEHLLDEAIRVARLAHSDADLRLATVARALAQGFKGHAREAMDVLRREVVDTAPSARSHRLALSYIGTMLYVQDRSQESLDWFSRAAAAFDQNNRRGNRGVALLGGALANLEISKAAEAERLLRAASEILVELQPEPSPLRADLDLASGRLALLHGQTDDARTALLSADSFWSKFDPGNRSAAEAAYWLGRAHQVSGQQAEYRAAMARAARIFRSSPLPLDQKRLRSLRQRA